MSAHLKAHKRLVAIRGKVLRATVPNHRREWVRSSSIIPTLAVAREGNRQHFQDWYYAIKLRMEHLLRPVVVGKTAH